MEAYKQSPEQHQQLPISLAQHVGVTDGTQKNVHNILGGGTQREELKFALNLSDYAVDLLAELQGETIDGECTIIKTTHQIN
ncbi:hypothetical protein A9Q91_02030 [Candidatus Gracilibacteria bacterium 28_42_T64]|nr:hypothetical protein A9Q91_02030 [Candidatus Gracilibacteria bacterium 28_42_T64]